MNVNFYNKSRKIANTMQIIYVQYKEEYKRWSSPWWSCKNGVQMIMIVVILDININMILKHL